MSNDHRKMAYCRPDGSRADPMMRPQPRFAGMVMDAAPEPLKPLQPLKFTQPKDLIVMDVNDDLPARRGVPGAATPADRVGRDEETSPQDDLCNKVYFYLEKSGAKEQDLEDFLSLWERVHKPEGQAMDRRSTRRAPRPMSASERTAFNTRFPHAGRLG